MNEVANIPAATHAFMAYAAGVGPSRVPYERVAAHEHERFSFGR